MPPYSPDFDPIEPLGSKIRQILRSPAARTFDGLIKAIGVALAQVTLPDLTGWFTDCGYAT